MLRWMEVEGRTYTLWGDAPGYAWFLIMRNAAGAHELYIRAARIDDRIDELGTPLGMFPSMDDAKFAAELMGEPGELYKRLNAKEG